MALTPLSQFWKRGDTKETIIKKKPTYQKLRGGYYTPPAIANFLARWAIQSPTDEVLEPSCGDGNLLEAAVGVLYEHGREAEAIGRQIQGVEFDAAEVAKANHRLKQLGIPELSGQIHQGDFFAYCRTELLAERFFNVMLSEGRQFDAILGNPPFIRYQNFPESHRKTAFSLMRQAGLNPNRLTNSWVPFLVAATLTLKKPGRLAMVIPAELLQVNYAAEIRQFLSDFYNQITLITFRELVFKDIQQEVVLLLAERGGHQNHNIRVIEVDGLDELAVCGDFSVNTCPVKSDGRKPLDNSKEKWTLYFLEPAEIQFLRRLKTHPKLNLSNNMIDVSVGMVTGRNDFFVLTEQQVEHHNLKAYTKRVVSRSNHLQGAIFSGTDWLTNVQKQRPAFLFYPPDQPVPPAIQAYIAQGEQQKVHQGYKCRIRRLWYQVPSIWIPDAFMLRQVHKYPKLILNKSGATCTDTIHRVRLLPGTDGRMVTTAFLNSLTFAFAEITGRSYGGGVLTFEPSEAKRLPIPLIGAEKLDFNLIDQHLRANSIEAVLDMTDSILLKDGLGLSTSEVRMLRGIWEKLRDRRINRKHKRKSRRRSHRPCFMGPYNRNYHSRCSSAIIPSPLRGVFKTN